MIVDNGWFVDISYMIIFEICEQSLFCCVLFGKSWNYVYAMSKNNLSVIPPSVFVRFCKRITWQLLSSQFPIDLYCWWSIRHLRVWGDKFGSDHRIIWSICHLPNWSHKFCIDLEGVALDWPAKCSNSSLALIIVTLVFIGERNYYIYILFLYCTRVFATFGR